MVADPAFELDEARVERTFMISFTLRDDADAGGSATTSFQWTVEA